MAIGTQIAASNGYESLLKGEIYHFLKSHRDSQRVFLVHFQGYGQEKPSAELIVMNRKRFEEGVDSGTILRSEVQNMLPPWLVPLQGIDLSLIDSFRPRSKKTYQSRVEDRLLHIAGALKDIELIWNSADPAHEIHRYARTCQPRQNESRIRLWLLTYLAFGRTPWALLPPYHRIGHWDRMAVAGVKYGRNSISNGARYGFRPSQEMINTMVEGYLEYAALGVSMRYIYQQTMLKKFGCKTIKSAAGIKRYIHPCNQPFPTEWQFYYRIKEEFGLEAIQRNLYGAVRYRSRIAASQGSFSESVANLLERIEADGYYTKELPKGYVEGSTLPALCVVVGRDVLSGKKLGIGFAFGKERSDAYRMMLFSMAVPKVFFCKLFGIDISEEDWTGDGLPPYFGVDRGPGAKRDLIKDFEKQFPIRDLAPSWSGQSKATVESSHPRDLDIEGQPTYIQSNLTPVELAKKEIVRLMKFNDSADMSGRFFPDPDLAFLNPSANELWDHYERRFRTDAQPMSIEDAVRTFLTPVEVLVDEHGVWLGDQKYDSVSLRESGLLDKVARASSIRIRGYVLDLCVRHIWVEIDGRLLMLDAKLKIRDSDEKLYYSLAELEQWGQARAAVKSEFREHQHASASEYYQRFEEATGEPWTAGRRRSGKPKRNAAVRHEEQEAASSHGKKGAA